MCYQVQGPAHPALYLQHSPGKRCVCTWHAIPMDQVASLNCQIVVTTPTCTAALQGCANILAMQVCPWPAAWQRSRVGPGGNCRNICRGHTSRSQRRCRPAATDTCNVVSTASGAAPTSRQASEGFASDIASHRTAVSGGAPSSGRSCSAAVHSTQEADEDTNQPAVHQPTAVTAQK